jgi:LPS-assembly lipoprotein
MRLVALATLLLVTLGLSACGFTMRGSAELPFRTLYNGISSDSVLADEFNRQARIASGTELVTNRSRAEAAIEVTRESRAKEAVSFSPSGRPREYLLRYQVTFQVRDANGVALLEPTEISLRRYITTTDVEVLSAQLEEEFLYREMQTDMAQQILRRISVVRRDG